MCQNDNGGTKSVACLGKKNKQNRVEGNLLYDIDVVVAQVRFWFGKAKGPFSGTIGLHDNLPSPKTILREQYFTSAI